MMTTHPLHRGVGNRLELFLCLQMHVFPSTYEAALPLETLEFLVDGNNFSKV